ncbi:hypothetical protein [Streptomyces sp. NBC_01483]|uniref:hypothetical protein n=1 Tax=Streptomyces sp. NBC_01483 TaxID=2903883 RepID=UPI002E2FEE68|nr:hypothetical protein [Streptomyces sp. NBC_01483]
MPRTKALRDSVLERTEVLDRVKALSLLPDGMHVTTAMVAAYFEVAERAINRMAPGRADSERLAGPAGRRARTI